jgi:acetylornithine deacetylase/succinyl-diaminopimelate desuccinylase-like protein
MHRPLAAALACALLHLFPARADDAWTPACAPPAGFDRERAARDARELLEGLIRLDTRNPPGNEGVAAELLAARLRGLPGVEVHVLDVGEGRANLIARLVAGRPAARPVIVMGHLDVVGTQDEKWTSPPLVPTERGPHLYGRGAIDCKGPLAASVAALLQLHARRAELGRDVILLATAAEEGGPNVGVDWVLEHARAHLHDAELALNEGGRVRVEGGRVKNVNVQTTEKVYYEVRARAQGPSGHGSVPLPDNALAALARAVARVHAWRPPLRLTDTTRRYFAALAAVEPDPALAAAMRGVGDPAAQARAVEALERVPQHAAVLRVGVALTKLEGGFRANVIPSEGTATFNVRTVPGEDIAAVVSALQDVGAEPQVKFELVGEPRTSPPESPVTTPLYLALEAAARAMAPDAPVIPFMSTGATDGAALRAAGIPTYGILPFPLEQEDELRMHGDDERVPVRALAWGTELLYRTLLGVAGPQ